MTRNGKIATIVTVVLVFGIAIAIAIVIGTRPDETESQRPDGTTSQPVLAPDTHVLDEGAGDVVLVEFLDFECEVCGAFYPQVEQLREEYAGEVTFAFRYFPIPSHLNSMDAALAVEAAARQGEVEGMYSLMFETQQEWYHQAAGTQTDRFRGYAEQLGLDLDQYDADIASDDARERIESDARTGRGIGVGGTPTFFLNDRRLELQSIDDLRTAVEAAVNP